jgi:predicted  nucleic acid-binding Zn-ribbon protein
MSTFDELHPKIVAKRKEMNDLAGKKVSASSRLDATTNEKEYKNVLQECQEDDRRLDEVSTELRDLEEELGRIISE